MTKPRHCNRRQFLQTSGLALAALSSGNYLQAQGTPGKPLLVGSGEHTYEIHHDWGQLPDSIVYGNTHGVCVDSNGRIYIKHTVGKGSPVEDAILVFDEKGKFIRSWGSEFKGGAHGLHINLEDNQEVLYLADQARHLVVKTDLNGNDILRLGCPIESGLYSSQDEYRPTNVATAPNGDFYVADGYGKSWIHHYNPKGEYIRSFGGPGKERGQTLCPHGLMIDTRGKEPELVVADRSNRRLQYFALDGRHLRFVTDELRAPCHFAQQKGCLLIPDLEARVTLFDEKNKVITHLGDGGHYRELRDQPRQKFIPGKFIAPHSAYFDSQGNIYVVEWVEVGRVTKLTRV